jgi:hypothetical protein
MIRVDGSQFVERKPEKKATYLVTWFATGFISSVLVNLIGGVIFPAIPMAFGFIILAILNLCIWTVIYIYVSSKFVIYIKKVIPWVWVSGALGAGVAIEMLTGYFTIPYSVIPLDVALIQITCFVIGAGGFQYIFKYHYPEIYFTEDELLNRPSHSLKSNALQTNSKMKNHEANVQKKSVEIENETVEIKLEKLKTLYDRGLIKEEVYVSKQHELLSKL